MQTIQIPNNWGPRPYQRGIWDYFEKGGVRGVGLCHRRWGKDEVALHLTATKVMERQATYWHMLPKAAQARKAIWLAVNPHTGNRRIDEAFPKEIRRRTNDNEMFIEFINGSFWHVVGSDNYNSLVGSSLGGVVLSEWSLADPAVWAYLEPILLESNGWAIFIYTSRGKNHGYTMAKLADKSDHWYYDNQTADDTGVFTSEQLKMAKESLIGLYGKDMGELLFQQEYYNSFEGGVLGAYYATDLYIAEKQGRITNVPYVAGEPVTVYFDLGNAPNLSMWFGQHIGLEPHVIDYEAPTITGVDEIKRILQDKRYNYEELVLPHDGGHKQMGDKDGRTFDRILEDATRIPCRVLPRTDLLPGLSSVYGFIGRMLMDKEKCADGLQALYSYKRDWNDKLMKFSDNPCHDWASHPSDAFRYMSVDFEPGYNGPPAKVVTNI